MIAFDNYAAQSSLGSETVPEWFKAERYEYCENAFEGKKVPKIISWFAMLISMMIG